MIDVNKLSLSIQLCKLLDGHTFSVDYISNEPYLEIELYRKGIRDSCTYTDIDVFIKILTYLVDKKHRPKYHIGSKIWYVARYSDSEYRCKKGEVTSYDVYNLSYEISDKIELPEEYIFKTKKSLIESSLKIMGKLHDTN